MLVQSWPISRFVPYERNPRKNDAAVDRMCASIREFGFKGGDTTGIPLVLCDEWSEVQVKAFRLMVNRSVGWADWDDEALALELQELAALDFNLDLTGFDPKEIDDLLLSDEDDQADAVPPLPANPVSRLGDLWLCGNGDKQHRVLCGDATSPEAVARLLGDCKPLQMVSDPPYGIKLDTDWRDRGRAERMRTRPS